MKRIAAAALILLLPFLLCAETEEVSDGIDALLDTIDVEEWDEWFRETDAEGMPLPSDYLRDLAETERGIKSELTLGDLIGYLVPLCKGAAFGVLLFLGLAIFGAALNGLSEHAAVGESAQTAFRVGVSSAVLLSAFSEIHGALQLFLRIDRTAEILLPVLISFLTLNGMTNTAALLPASYTLLSETVLKLIRFGIVPLAAVGGVLLVLDAGGTGRLASFGKLLQRAAKWLLGTVCAVFLIVTAIRSAAAGSADGVLLRTTKLAAGSIPSVGSLLSESVDAGFQCLKFVRSVLGLTGCAVLLAVVWKPILSLAAARCAFRASALLSEPLSGRPYAELLRGIADTLHLFLLSEIALTAMTLLVIAPVFGAGGTT